MDGASGCLSRSNKSNFNAETVVNGNYFFTRPQNLSMTATVARYLFSSLLPSPNFYKILIDAKAPKIQCNFWKMLDKSSFLQLRSLTT